MKTRAKLLGLMLLFPILMFAQQDDSWRIEMIDYCEQFVPNYYALLNNYSKESGDNRRLFKQELMNNYMDDGCQLENDLTEDGTDWFSAKDYLGMLGAKFPYEKHSAIFEVSHLYVIEIPELRPRGDGAILNVFYMLNLKGKNNDGVMVNRIRMMKAKVIFRSNLTDNARIYSTAIADDDFAWSGIKKQKEKKLYQAYIDFFPNGNHVAEAEHEIRNIERIENVAKDNAKWAEVDSIGSEDRYEQYLHDFPQGIHADEAKDEIAWAIATKANTIEAYDTYLDNTSLLGRHSKVGREKRSDLVKKANAQSEKIEDRKDWENAKQKNSLSGYETYVRLHPNGYYVGDARQKIKFFKTDAEKWRKAKKKNTKESYEKYLAWEKGNKDKQYEELAQNKLDVKGQLVQTFSLAQTLLLPGLNKAKLTDRPYYIGGIVSYGLMGAGGYYYLKSQKTFDKYLTATEQDNIKKFKNDADKEQKLSRVMLLSGVAVYVVGVVFDATSKKKFGYSRVSPILESTPSGDQFQVGLALRF